MDSYEPDPHAREDRYEPESILVLTTWRVSITIATQLKFLMDYLRVRFVHSWNHKFDDTTTAWYIEVYTLAQDEMRLPHTSAQRSHVFEGRVGWKVVTGDVTVFRDNLGEWCLTLHRNWRRIAIGIEKNRMNPERVQALLHDVIQQVFRAAIIANNGVVIHASGVADESGAYIFPGGPGSGKTTCMLDLLATGQFQWMANDDVNVVPPRVALPSIYGPSIAMGTLRNSWRYKDLANPRLAVKYGQFVRSLTGELKLYIPVSKLSEALNASIASPSKVKAIVFPCLVRNTRAVWIESMTLEAGLEKLLPELSLRSKEDGPDWLGLTQGCGLVVEQAELRSRAREMFDGVRWGKLYVGCLERAPTAISEVLRLME